VEGGHGVRDGRRQIYSPQPVDRDREAYPSAMADIPNRVTFVLLGVGAASILTTILMRRRARKQPSLTWEEQRIPFYLQAIADILLFLIAAVVVLHRVAESIVTGASAGTVVIGGGVMVLFLLWFYRVTVVPIRNLWRLRQSGE
jgi:hypothetical protein